jgi:hypothetical protein
VLNREAHHIDVRNFGLEFDTVEEAALWEEAMEQSRLQFQHLQDTGSVYFPLAHTSGKRAYGFWETRCELPALYLFLTEVHFANLKKNQGELKSS